ncbi:MAG: hypothetical protein U0V73_09100 [Acidimicrobiia bacterium]
MRRLLLTATIALLPVVGASLPGGAGVAAGATLPPCPHPVAPALGGPDLRKTADQFLPKPGAVVHNVLGYLAATIDNGTTMRTIVIPSKTLSAPIVSVWENAEDCNGWETSRNAWAAGPTGVVYASASNSGPAAGFYGDMRDKTLNKPIVGMSPTFDGKGYWLVASDGGIFAFGDAQFYGSTGAMRLNKPIVGMAVTATGAGYYLVASDGGIFAFGDAQFYGSTGALTLNKPISGMTTTSSGLGYWMTASDGGIFAFGDATFHGSTGDRPISAPIVGMIPNGSGYSLIGNDGKVYPFK